MREIKFRQALLNTNGEFQSFHYWGFMPEGEFVGPETSLSSVSEALKNSKPYIGLRDWKGREIYEGDIVACYRLYDKEPYFVSPIIYTAHCSAYFHVRRYVDVYDDFSGFAEDDLSHYGLEVIGNIYENPEIKETENEQH